MMRAECSLSKWPAYFVSKCKGRGGGGVEIGVHSGVKCMCLVCVLWKILNRRGFICVLVKHSGFWIVSTCYFSCIGQVMSTRLATRWSSLDRMWYKNIWEELERFWKMIAFCVFGILPGVVVCSGTNVSGLSDNLLDYLETLMMGHTRSPETLVHHQAVTPGK